MEILVFVSRRLFFVIFVILMKSGIGFFLLGLRSPTRKSGIGRERVDATCSSHALINKTIEPEAVIECSSEPNGTLFMFVLFSGE